MRSKPLTRPGWPPRPEGAAKAGGEGGKEAAQGEMVVAASAPSQEAKGLGSEEWDSVAECEGKG